MRCPLLCLFVVFLLGSARGAEPFLKKGDVIALVGGEDMVVASEYGYLELMVIHALPDYHLRFRNLAWEGDTVFEQRRDLNFPTWEEQLDKIGATVVICQFGQMESLGGKEKLPEFIAAYEKLLDRLGGGKRRFILIPPLATPNGLIASPYADAVADLAKRRGAPFVDTRGTVLHDPPDLRPDLVHLNEGGQASLAVVSLLTLGLPSSNAREEWESLAPLRQLIIAKNRLWFNYWRVQNWAFLAGDRTNQPSSRDWRDPSKRWFPAEREEFLPLIEAKEKEIDALAEKSKSN